MEFTADPYDVLKIKPTADSSEISHAYHNLARQLHPDKNSAPNAKELFQQLNQAYQVLTDSVQRSKLDNQRAAKIRELQKWQQVRETQLKYQQQLIEQKARDRAFQFQEQQKLQQQKLEREQALRNQMKQNQTNQNPTKIKQDIIYDLHQDATAKLILEQLGIQTNDICNNSSLRVDNVKKQSKMPCHITPGVNRSSHSMSSQPPSVNQGACIQINTQPRVNNAHSINIMHNMANTNNMNGTNCVKFQQRPPVNAFNQQIPSHGPGQRSYQQIRVDSINRRPKPLHKTPIDVKLREQNQRTSFVFDLSMLEAQLMAGVCKRTKS